MYHPLIFIPSNNNKYLSNSKEFGESATRVFDLEDSIFEKDLHKAIELLKTINITETDWLRPPLNAEYFQFILNEASNMGFINYVIPKCENIIELNSIILKVQRLCPEAKFILLVEHPNILINLNEILKKHASCISGISLGLHDFCSVTDIRNDYKNLRQIRMDILLMAKAYNIKAIDVVSMNIKNRNEFLNEIEDSIDCGYREKFIIHPFQLELINNYKHYSSGEIDRYIEIINYYRSEIAEKKAVFSYKGQVYEKMHIKKIEKIAEWGKKYYGTNRSEL